MTIAPIGQVRSCYLDKFGTPRQPGLAPHSRAFLEIDPQWQPEQSLQGLEAYSHLWVIFEFHKNSHVRFHAKVRPPRLGGESIGVFATRSPHRPNSIGLSVVKILSVEKNGVWVSGIDLIEATPILDIKPYLPEVEVLPEAKGGWSANVVAISAQIEWQPKALVDLQAWHQRHQAMGKEILETKTRGSIDELRQLVEETLKLDPRPLIYRGYEGRQSKYRDEHAVRIWDGDVHFKFLSEELIQILSIHVCS